MTTAPAKKPNRIPTIRDWRVAPEFGAATQTPTPDKAIHLTTAQRRLVIGVVIGAIAIAGIGFAGSYMAVTELAKAKKFGDFSYVFTIGVDVGIVLFLALDLLLTWLRIPFPMLRQIAWMLTAATISFNAVASWPDPVGVAMHGVIPILFVGAVEAARHAIGRIADIVADKHFENPPFVRWLVAFPSTFRLWRWQRKNNVHSYDRAVKHQREVKIYRARLRQEYGRSWRRTAPADKRLVLTLARFGMSIVEAIELPETEARKRAEAELKQKLAQAQAEAEARSRLAAAAEAEAEAIVHAELKRAEAEANRTVIQAETEAKLAAILRKQRDAEAAAELEERQRKQAEVEAARKAKAAADAKRIAEQALRGTGASGSDASGSGSGSGSKPNPKPAPKPKPTSGSGSGSDATNLGGARSKRASEVEAVLVRITEAGDPEAVSLEWVEKTFGLKQTTAWDRLKTARQLWSDAQAA